MPPPLTLEFPITEEEASTLPKSTPSPSDAGDDGTLDQAISRPQRRLLRRIYNGRVDPIVVNDIAFLTYKEAQRYLLSLEPEAREQVYAQMKAIGITR